VFEERLCRTCSERDSPRISGQVEVLEEGGGPGEAPGGQQGAAEFRGQAAAHPVVVRMVVVAEQQGDAERARQAEELQPRQDGEVHVVGERRRGDQRGRDVQEDRQHDHPPELGGAPARGMVAFLLESEDRLRRLERVPGIPDRCRGEPVQLGEARVRPLEVGQVLAAHLERVRVDEDQGLSKRPRIRDHVGRAPLPARRLAVPDGEKHVGPVDGRHPAVEVRVLARPVLGYDPHVLRALKRCLHRGPLLRGEVLREFRLGKRQDRVPCETERPCLLDEELVAPSATDERPSHSPCACWRRDSRAAAMAFASPGASAIWRCPEKPTT